MAGPMPSSGVMNALRVFMRRRSRVGSTFSSLTSARRAASPMPVIAVLAAVPSPIETASASSSGPAFQVGMNYAATA